MEKPTGSAPAGAKDQVEKQARQLAYDVRYKVRGALKAQSGGQSDPATVRKAYLSQLGKSPASPPVKARAKSMLVGEDYVNVNKLATESAVSALYRVFVEGIHEQEEVQEESGEKTYKIRVTDKKTGNSYVRMASRAKISELRSNPNISSVEMTGYGEPTKSEKYAGKKTAAVKAGKDFDGDGKRESSSKEHAGVVHNAIQKKKGGVPDGRDTRKENYNWKDGFSELIEKKKEEKKKLTGKGVNNKKLIKVFPVQENSVMDPKAGQGSGLSGLGGMDVEGAKETGVEKAIAAKQKKADQIKKQVLLKKLQAVRQGGGESVTASYQPKSGMVEDAEYGYDKEGNSLNPKDKKKKEEQEDPRSMGTKYRNIKNRLRSMGLKCGNELEGDVLDEGGYHRIEGEYEGKGGKKEKVSGKFLKLPDKVGKGVKRNTDHRHELGKIKDAVTDTLGITNTKRDGVRKHSGLKGALQMQNSYEPEGEVVDEEGYDHYRDQRLMKYGIGHSGSDKSGPSPRPTGKRPKGDTNYQKEMRKKHGGKLPSALDVVRAKIEKESGKGSIMDTKKK